MNTRTVITALVVALAVFAAGSLFGGSRTPDRVIERAPLGGMGGDVFNYLTVHGAFTQGGGVLSSSTPATATTFRAVDLLNYSTWEITPELSDLTYTFPASSTITFIPNPGDSRTWTIVNATTTAGIDVIFASGTGSAIKATGGGGLTLDEDSHGTIMLTRKVDSDIVISVSFPNAD